MCLGGRLQIAFRGISCSGNNASLDRSSWPGSVYSAGILRSIGTIAFEPLENRKINPVIGLPLIVPLLRYVMAILRVSQQECKPSQPLLIHPPHRWITHWIVPLPKGLQFYFLLLSPLKLNEVGTILWKLDLWNSVGTFCFQPPSSKLALCNLYHPVHRILLSICAICSDNRH
jgi:hypothetical protein